MPCLLWFSCIFAFKNSAVYSHTHVVQQWVTDGLALCSLELQVNCLWGGEKANPHSNNGITVPPCLGKQAVCHPTPFDERGPVPMIFEACMATWAKLHDLRADSQVAFANTISPLTCGKWTYFINPAWSIDPSRKDRMKLLFCALEKVIDYVPRQRMQDMLASLGSTLRWHIKCLPSSFF